MLRVTAGIAAELIKAHDSNESVSLNQLRTKISKKFGYGGVPRLVDIISAIPDDYKGALLPKLKARPVRTASGVRLSLDKAGLLSNFFLDRRCRCNVQTTSLSTYRHDWEHLCVRTQSYLSIQLTTNSIKDIVLEDLTQTLITAPKVILATSLLACALSELGMTLTNKHEAEWNN